MPRRNHRGRPSRAKLYEMKSRQRPKGAKPAPRIEDMVIPAGRCHLRHRKLKFTKEKAAEALQQAQDSREARAGHTGHVEKRIYECEERNGGCGMWHLTSRDHWNENR